MTRERGHSERKPPVSFTEISADLHPASGHTHTHFGRHGPGSGEAPPFLPVLGKHQSSLWAASEGRTESEGMLSVERGGRVFSPHAPRH